MNILTEGKGAEMKKQWGPFTISTGEDAKVNRDDVPMTLEERQAKLRMMADFDHERLTKPSSKVGREIYWSQVGFFDLPFQLWESFRDWLLRNDVWYSETGRRSVVRTKRID